DESGLADAGRAGDADDGGRDARPPGGRGLVGAAGDGRGDGGRVRRAVLDGGEEPGHGPAVARAGRGHGVADSHQAPLRMTASPWPPPPHRPAAPSRPGSSWRARVWTRRAPEAPIGWPRAIAPPSGLTRSRPVPSAAAEERTTAAN